MSLDARMAALLDELHEHGVAHDADRPDRLQRLRNLEPDSARLLALLVRAAGVRSLLEIGTANGYSTVRLAKTVRLAEAVQATGGRPACPGYRRVLRPGGPLAVTDRDPRPAGDRRG